MIKGSHVSPVDAGIVVVIFSAVAVGVKPVVGWLTDRLGFGMRLPIMVILVLFTATLLVFGALRSYTAFLVVAPVLGITAYAYSPLTAAMIPKLVGGSLAGSAAGTVNAIWQLGSVLVPAAVGSVFDASGSFYSAFVVLAIGPLLGALAVLGVRDDRPHRSSAADVLGGGLPVGASSASGPSPTA